MRFVFLLPPGIKVENVVENDNETCSENFLVCTLAIAAGLPHLFLGWGRLPPVVYNEMRK